jgi:hypothetical protein
MKLEVSINRAGGSVSDENTFIKSGIGSCPTIEFFVYWEDD